MKPSHLTLFSLLLLSVLTAAVGRHHLIPPLPPPPPGTWIPIDDLKDSHVKDIAKFAVSEHNKYANTDLKLKTVVTGEKQLVSGTNYRLVISVTGGVKDYEKYLVVVWEKSWDNYKKLTAFKPLED